MWTKIKEGFISWKDSVDWAYWTRTSLESFTGGVLLGLYMAFESGIKWSDICTASGVLGLLTVIFLNGVKAVYRNVIKPRAEKTKDIK